MPSLTMPSTLDGCMKLPYEVRIFEVDGDFIVTLAELSLVGRGEDLNTAYAVLNERKREYFQALLDAGRDKDIRPPREWTERRDLIRGLLPFTIKLLSAAIVVVVVVLALLPAIEVQLRDVRVAARLAGREIPKGMIEGFAELRALPPEKQRKIEEAVRIYLESVKPIIDTAREVLEDGQPSGEGEAGGPSH